MDDGNGFDVTEEFVMNQPDGSEATVRSNRRWILSADGKTLTIEMVVENPNGASKSRSRSRRVFVKK
jgi:ribulose bisphosphate carboxylase small subunit